MTCDHGRETVVRTGEAPSLGRKADRIALTGEVRGFPRLNRRPDGRGHGAQGHGDSGGNGRGVSLLLYRVSMISYGHPLQKLSSAQRSVEAHLRVAFPTRRHKVIGKSTVRHFGIKNPLPVTKREAGCPDRGQRGLVGSFRFHFSDFRTCHGCHSPPSKLPAHPIPARL